MKLFLKNATALGALTGALALVACDRAEMNNPKTVGRDDLNPPSKLMTVTQSGKIELRWSAANAEDDFKGYYVFAAKKSLDELKALAVYPSGVDITAGEQVPRCKDNSAFFEAFGLSASDADCEGSPTTEATTTAFAPAGTQFLQTNTTESPSKVIANFVGCEGVDSTYISLPKTGVVTTPQKCVVTKAYVGTGLEALADGVTYTFFVTSAVPESDDGDAMSWTSNIVQDTPSTTALSKVGSEAVTIGAEKFVTFSLGSTFAATAADQANCSGDICRLAGLNNGTTDAIYLARDNSSSAYKQRLFLSTKSGGNIQIQARGPQTTDPWSDTPQVRIPGDEALPSSGASAYPVSGFKFTVKNNQVFDIKWTNGTATHYGKIVIGDVTYATDMASDAKVEVTIILQKAPDNLHYFH